MPRGGWNLAKGLNAAKTGAILTYGVLSALAAADLFVRLPWRWQHWLGKDRHERFYYGGGAERDYL